MPEASEMYQRIQQLCRQGHTNITAMCRALAIPRSVLSELASGRTKSLSAGNVARIAAYFGVPAEALLGMPPSLHTDAVPTPLQPEYLRLAWQLQAMGLNDGQLQSLMEIAIQFQHEKRL